MSSVFKLLRSLPPPAVEEAVELIQLLTGHRAQLAATREFLADYPTDPVGARMRLASLVRESQIHTRAELHVREIGGSGRRRHFRGHGTHGHH